MHSMQCIQYLSQKFSAKGVRADDWKISFNHTLPNLSLFWDQSIFLFVHMSCFLLLFIILRKWQYSIFGCQKGFLLQFHPNLLRTPFTIIHLDSRNLIGFQYLGSHKMYHLVLIECLQIILLENFGKSFRNII